MHEFAVAVTYDFDELKVVLAMDSPFNQFIGNSYYRLDLSREIE